MAIRSSLLGNLNNNTMMNSSEHSDKVKIPSGNGSKKSSAAPEEQPKANTQKEVQHLKTIKIPTVNRRLSTLREEFGVNSEIYKAAESYIDEHLDDKFINRDGFGNIVSISKGKEALNLNKLFGRSDVFDEYIPTVTQVYKRELEAQRQLYEDRSEYMQGPLTPLEAAFEGGLTERNVRKIVQDPQIARYLRGKAEQMAELLADYDGTVDETYVVRDNKYNVPDVSDLQARAQELLDNRTKTVEWVRQAQEVIIEYKERTENFLREWIEQQY